MEHFVTLASHHFLPQVIALSRSLQRHSPAHRLWVLAMDAELERALSTLGIATVEVLPLSAVEDDRLRAVKQQRTLGEYCWTLSSFTFDAVFARAPTAQRITYVDADLWFLRDPAELLDPLTAAGRHVLVTEHGFSPAQQHLLECGRFCVQFLCFDRSLRATEIRRWWQERCLEWCYDRIEPERFGDQKYLDRWPELFGDALLIVDPPERCVGPWNADRALVGGHCPVFIHLHGLRLMAGGTVRLWTLDYRPGPAAELLWRDYLNDFRQGCAAAIAVGCPVVVWPDRRPQGLRSLLLWLVRRWQQRTCYVRLPALPLKLTV